jgi:crotonobetainyl-CoA:carnitine CoA-transferase CaiB-like acyl-CoA transferase
MGPLAGLKVIELAGIGPGPMAAMLLADLGAEVLRIDRLEPADLGIKKPLKYNLLARNRKSIATDLKDPESIELVLKLVEGADVLLEGFRPGVTERLGLGPEACQARNPKLVYGRITGWGQTGPLASVAGHDINYISLTGALHAIGAKGQAPAIPLALLGDMSGGVYMALGILAAIFEARVSGTGQVVDSAISDSTAHMTTAFYGLVASGQWDLERGNNVLDSGAHYYNCYQCADDRWISIGPIEARFYAQLLEKLDLDPSALGAQNDKATWDQSREALAKVFRSKPRDAWCALLEGTDVCFAPVLTFAEAPEHAHLKARGTFVEVDGVVQPAPAPRFSRTPAGMPTAPQAPVTDGLSRVLAGWLPQETLNALL